MPARIFRPWPFCATAFVAALLLASAISRRRHDIPNDVTAQVFLKPAGNTLHLLVRVPLKAMSDVDFPERGPGYLDLDRVDDSLPRRGHVVDFRLHRALRGRRPPAQVPTVVATRMSLESDRSFASYDEALAHRHRPASFRATPVFWNQVMFDVLFDYPIQSDQSRFSINPDGRGRLGEHVVIALRFVPPGGYGSRL